MTILEDSIRNDGTSTPSSSANPSSETHLHHTQHHPQPFRSIITNQMDSRFTPEPNRYHLYVAYACPWSHRTTMVRNLKGLQKVIGVTYVHPTWQYTKPDVDDHRGWVFGSSMSTLVEEEPETFEKLNDITTETFFTNTEGKGSFPSSWGEQDILNQAKTVRELYEIAEQNLSEGTSLPDYVLPILWDRKERTIVSNDSSEIIRMFNTEFNDYAIHPNVDLYPQDLASDIDAANGWIYPKINDGVYKCGLALTQQEYDHAMDELTQSFDRVESILKSQRYIVGDRFTEADVRLFVTLLRWDEVYDIYFRCNSRSVRSTPTLLNYVRDIYQMPGVAETCRMDMIKAHYFTSHVELNKYSIIPVGEGFEELLKKKPNDKGH